MTVSEMIEALKRLEMIALALSCLMRIKRCIYNVFNRKIGDANACINLIQNKK